mgnify:CR=1 FL=1
MPIRVEYGPSAVAVGELAFRTGQNEYIAKRRKEMEELAQRQAEMRQRGQIQQQNLQADLFKFHGQQQRAMQELQLRQQEFQQRGMQFEQGQQHDLKLAEDRRKHDLDLQKVYGDRQVADARMRHGLASQRDYNTFRRNSYADIYKGKLNESGQIKMMEYFKQLEDLNQDTRIPPEERKRSENEIYGKIDALEEDPQYTIDAELQPGYSEGWGAQDGGYESNTPYTRTRKQNGEWEYRQNYSYYEQDENGEWQERQLTPKEWVEIYQPEPFIVGEQKYIADGFNYETGQWNYAIDETYDPNAEANATKAEAAENEERINKRLEMYNKYVSGFVDPAEADDFATWQQNTYGDTIIGGAQPAPAPAGQPVPAPAGQQVPAPQPAPDPAAVVPPQAQPAPQPAGDQFSVDSHREWLNRFKEYRDKNTRNELGPEFFSEAVAHVKSIMGDDFVVDEAAIARMSHEGFDRFVNMLELGLDEFGAAQPVEQTPPEQQVQPDQPAGPVQNPAAPLGTQENPHQVINQAEAEQMVQNGEIQPGDIVTTADGIQFSAGEPPEPAAVMEERNERLAAEVATHRETLAGMRAAIERGDRKYMAALVPRINAMFRAINRRHPKLQTHGVIDDYNVQQLTILDGEEFERVIKLAEMYWPEEFGEIPTEAKPFVHEPTRRENEAIKEQAEAQRLDAIEAANREPSIYTPLEQRKMQENADSLLQRAGISKEEAEAMDREYRRQNAAIAAGSPGGPDYKTPMEMGPDGPQITGYKLVDGEMKPLTAPGREYMAELERRDAESRDRYESIDYQPAQEDVSKYGINQNWETRFGQGPPKMQAHRISSPAGQSKVEYHPSDQYKVAVYPGAEVADQSTMEGISLQMQYNTSAWQRDPNHRVERVSAEQLMEQTRRKLNPQPKWQGPLQGF